MNIDFETPMAALLAHWQATCAVGLTANAAAASAVLTDVSNFDGLFPGLPVFGPGAVKGVTILSLDPDAATITLSDPLASAATDAAFIAGFQTFGRRVQHWSEVAAQPALFLRRIGATDEDQETFMVTTLECEGWIYCNAGQNPDLAPDTGLTALERMVRQSFAPDGDYGDPKFTLGGLVYWCRIEGRTDSSPGDLDPQALAKLPIRITLP